MSGSQALPVASPCIGVCRMDDRSGLCEGCLRTLDEIVVWGEASDALRRVILARVSARREAASERATAPVVPNG